MELIYTAYNIIIQLVLIILIFHFAFKYAKKKHISLPIVFFLVVFQIGLTYISAFFSAGTHSDPPMYFLHAQEAETWFSLFGVSSTSIRFLIYPFVNYLFFNYYTIFIFFGIFSIVSFLLLYDMLLQFKVLKIGSVDIKYLILFLPMYHVWMSFLGKDSLTFMATMFLLREFIRKEFIYIKVILPILILVFVRPYLLIFALLAITLVFSFQKINSSKRFLLLIGLMFFGLIAGFLILYLLKIDIMTYFSERLDNVSYYSHYKKEGSFLDPKQMGWLEKIFAYLFRPFFYDAKGIGQLYVSFENLFFFILFIKFIIVFNYQHFKKSFKLKVLFLYCLIFLIVNSYLIYNLGLVNRQKYMIVPIFIYLLYYFNNLKKNNVKAIE